MLRKSKSFVVGFICCAVIMVLAGTAMAASRTVDATLTFRDIKLVIGGTLFTPKDSAGNVVEPFILSGTTYLPVRAVGEAFGQEVKWDGETSTVYIGSESDAPAPLPSGGALTKVVPPYDRHILATIVDNVMMSGVMYYDAIRFQSVNSVSSQYTYHNLGGTFTKITGHIGKIDGAFITSATIRFFGDGTLIDSFLVTGGEMPLQIDVDVTGVTQLRIEIVGSALSSSDYAIAATIE